MASSGARWPRAALEGALAPTGVAGTACWGKTAAGGGGALAPGRDAPEATAPVLGGCPTAWVLRVLGEPCSALGGARAAGLAAAPEEEWGCVVAAAPAAPWEGCGTTPIVLRLRSMYGMMCGL